MAAGVHQPGEVMRARGGRLGSPERARGLLSPLARRTRAGRVTVVVVWVSLTAIAVTTFFPLYWLVTSALKSPLEVAQIPISWWPQSWHWESFGTAWDRLNFKLYFENSVILALGVTCFSVTASCMAAYSLSRLRLPFKKTITASILLVLMIPSMVYFVPEYLVVSNLPFLHISLTDTWWAVWLPAIANPISIYLLKQFFDRIPRELTDSAQIDGAGTWRIFISIMLPLARPAVGVVVILALIAGWKELLWPLVVLQDEHLWPLEVALLQFGQAKSLAVNIEMAAMTIATLPMIAIFILFQQHILKGITLTDNKG